MNATSKRPELVEGRIPAGLKFGILFCAGIGLYVTTWLPILVAALLIAIVALLLTREPARRLVRPIAGLMIIIGVVVIMTGVTTGWHSGVISGLRLTTLCLLAYAIAVSTRFSEVLRLFERVLAPSARIGLNPARISLALALTVRFIPELRQAYGRIREAQHARGLANRPVATLIPLIVHVLLAAEQISEAIDARAYDSTDRTGGTP